MFTSDRISTGGRGKKKSKMMVTTRGPEYFLTEDTVNDQIHTLKQ